MDILLHRGIIWTNDGELIPDGSVLIRDGKVSKVFSDPKKADVINAKSVRDFNCYGKLIIPGLVNLHTHLYSSLARALVLPGYSPASFSDVLEGLWWSWDRGLTEEAIRVSALVGGIEQLKHGVTTMFDHHSSPNVIEGSLSGLKRQICDKLGMRGCFCFEVSDRNGSERCERGIEENADWLTEVARDHSPFTSGAFGLHASFTLSDETLNKIRSVVDDEGVGYHIHFAEGRVDQRDCLDRYGMRVGERLDREGLLNPKTLLIHGVHLSSREMNIVAQQESTVVHCPQSNMNNAVGVADVEGMVDRGITVGLGNDGFGSNFLQEMKEAFLLHKIHRNDPTVMSSEQVGKILFRNNYRVAEKFFDVKLGKISPGYEADIAVIDYNQPTPLSKENFYSHLIFGLAAGSLDVCHLFVQGKVVIEDSTVVGVDERKIYQLSRELAKDLWGKMI